MATGTVPPTPPPLPPDPPSGPPPQNPAAGQYVEYDSYIENRIKKTRGQVKGLEAAVGLITLVAGVLGYLLTVAILDHWVVPGGLGFWGRLLALVGLLAGGTYWFVRRVLPVFLRPINPVYAAREIERNQSNLKNSLINFLLLRSRRTNVSPAVFDTLKQRAASDLFALPSESTLDRSQVIRFGYVLLAVVVLCCLYTLFSPKNPLQSVARVMLPWQDIAPVTRVSISNVSPGDTTAFHDEVATVSAIVEGVGSDEPVTLYYTTTDERIVDRALPMHVPDGDYRHVVQLPGDASGFQHSLDYYIAAGDARTPTFHVEVVSAPVITVERVEYEYPAYTGLAPRVADRQGDLRGIDGTRVTLSAKANCQIDEAHVDFDADGRRDLKMTTDGREARVTFPLQLDKNGQPQYTSYVLRFHDDKRHENLRPTRYAIEVIPDLRPEVELTRPGKDHLLVAENGALTMAVRAVDRDYALDQVSLVAERDGELVMREVLLGEERSGEFLGTYVFRPADHGLSAGDQIVYWAEAADNRRPTSNHSRTVQFHLEIVEELSREDATAQERAAENERRRLIEDENAESGIDRNDAAEGATKREDGQPAAREDAEAGDGESNVPEASERIDPETDAGEAFERLHKRFQDEAAEGEQPEEGSPQGKGDQPPGEMNDQKTESGQPQDGSAGQKEGQGQGGEGEPSGDSGTPGGESKKNGRPGDGASAEGEAGPDAKSDGGAESPNAKERPGRNEPSNEPGSEQPGAGSAAPDENMPQDQGGGGDSEKSKGKSGGPSGFDKPQQESKPGGEQDGKGGRTGGSGKVDSEEPPGETSDKGGEKEGGDPNNINNQSGAGKPSDDQSGSPQPQEKNQQSDTGKPSPSDQQETNPGEADSPSTSPKQSDSKGDTAGDRSGGGSKGGGQNANQEGTGGAGSNTAADEGSGEAAGSGEGNTSNQPGDRQRSDKATDREGPKSRGDGSQVKDGSKPGGDPAPSGAKPDRQDGTSGETPPDAPRQDGGQTPPEGGQPAQGSGDSSAKPGRSGNQAGDPGHPTGNLSGKDRPESTVPGGGKQESDGTGGDAGDGTGGGDDPNLEYAKKATDLVLEKLQDQIEKDKVDQEMLDELGWTKDDLKKFVDRWNQMRGEAQRDTPEGAESRRRLDNALKGLGLQPKGTSLETGQVKKTTDRQTRAARRSQPPPEYRDQFQAYSKSLAKDKSVEKKK